MALKVNVRQTHPYNSYSREGITFYKNDDVIMLKEAVNDIILNDSELVNEEVDDSLVNYPPIVEAVAEKRENESRREERQRESETRREEPELKEPSAMDRLKDSLNR